MKYYSEKLKRCFDTEKECLEAEEAKRRAEEEKKRAEEKAKAEKELAVKKKNEERSKDYEAIQKLKKEKDEAYKIYADCDKTYRDALVKFINTYGGYHVTYSNVDDIGAVNDIFTTYDKLFNNFFKFI